MKTILMAMILAGAVNVFCVSGSVWAGVNPQSKQERDTGGNAESRKRATDTIRYQLGASFNNSQVIARKAKITLVKNEGIDGLRIDTEAQNDPYGIRTFPKSTNEDLEHYSGITLPVKNGPWDLSTYKTIAVDITNLDDYGNIARIRIDSECNGKKKMVSRSIWLGRKESRTLLVSLNEINDSQDRIFIPNVKKVPSWAKQTGIDISQVSNFLISLDNPQFSHSVIVSNLRVEGQRVNDTPEKILPFIDEFGQYVHKDWPGKVHSDNELKTNAVKEKNDLADHPRTTEWDNYGGWANGPKLQATGFFRVEKYNDKWWLVTPVGTLFFSQGTQTIDTWQSTAVSDDKDKHRSKWFAPFPTNKFIFYIKSLPGTTWYDYGSSNLYRKYGENHREIFFDITHERLASWGINSIGNCSNLKLCGQNKTPFFIKAVPAPNCPVLEGDKFYDVFDPDFQEKLKKGIRHWTEKYAANPWCVGFFVDNELRWGMNEDKLPLEVIKSPDSATKKVFISDLQKKYETIDRLNKNWGRSYRSWDDMLKSTAQPDVSKAHEDLKAFYVKIAEAYFSMVRDELKKAAPNHLYFGPRFSNTGSNETVVRVAARYCDVLSINCYTPTVYNYFHDKHLSDLSGPIIISEFHFGAADRGLFNVGVGPEAVDQNERAEMYKKFVLELLADPRMVGTHYFQYRDQPLTGDVHHESGQIGFIDVADTPYPEIIRASREIAGKMYQYRIAAKGALPK